MNIPRPILSFVQRVGSSSDVLRCEPCGQHPCARHDEDPVGHRRLQGAERPTRRQEDHEGVFVEPGDGELLRESGVIDELKIEN